MEIITSVGDFNLSCGAKGRLVVECIKKRFSCIGYVFMSDSQILLVLKKCFYFFTFF